MTIHPSKLTLKQKVLRFLFENNQNPSVNATLNSLVKKYYAVYPEFFASHDLKPGDNMKKDAVIEGFNEALDDFSETASIASMAIAPAPKKEKEVVRDNNSAVIGWGFDEQAKEKLVDNIDALEAYVSDPAVRDEKLQERIDEIEKTVGQLVHLIHNKFISSHGATIAITINRK